MPPKAHGRLFYLLLSLIAVTLLAGMLLPMCVTSTLHGRRDYHFEGIVRDARTGRGLAGASLSLKLTRRGDSPHGGGVRMVSEGLAIWKDGSTEFRTTDGDGRFGFFYADLYNVSNVTLPWRGRGPERPASPEEFILTATRDGYVSVSRSLSPPPHRGEDYMWHLRGIVVELEPTAHPSRHPSVQPEQPRSD